MAVENRGVLIKQEDDTALRFVTAIADTRFEPPAAVTTGTCKVYLYHQKPGGTDWEIYNWSDNIFEAPGDASGADYYATASAVSVGTVGLGLWEKRLTTLTGFEVGHQYYVVFVHSAVVEADGMGPYFSFFQYGPPPVEGIWYSAGSDVVHGTLTLADATPCPQVVFTVRTTSDVLQASGMTDEQGQFDVQLDPGTYRVYFGPDSRYSFSTYYSLVVATNGQSNTFTCTATTYPDQGMTFGQIKAHVLNSLGEFAHSAAGYRVLTDDLVETWVRQAHYKLDADLEWTKARVTVASVDGTRRYTVDADVRSIYLVTYEGVELRRLNTEEEIVKQEASSSEGTPVYWAWWANELCLYPTPDTSSDDIVLYALKTPLALVDDTAIPDLPPQTHMLIVDYALAAGYQHVGDSEKAMAFTQMYEVGVAKERFSIANARGVNASVRRDGRVI